MLASTSGAPAFLRPLLLPPLWRRHSCQEHPWETRRSSVTHTLPLERLEELYIHALASHDEHRTPARGQQRSTMPRAQLSVL
ncbi:hypothetical protein F7725_027840 [Dissostichus mawsoni]|uniref:Uncharacterized protein n=1 Tax=Dissostichus mawsoni TaxID=36200 RepID=A0A7J5XE37_DISMA|nr:hypothetical protein F7725_027840 [Dissostichus mawsoni]